MSPVPTPSTTEPKGFYEEVLTRGERVRLAKARRVEGVDEEIALLRTRISTLAQERPEQFELLLKAISLVIRAVAVKYKLSPQSEQDLAKSIANVVRDIGALVMPDGANDG